MASAVLSAHKREEIRVGLEAEESLSDIARRLDRVPSTITREVIRNGGRRRYCAVRAQGRRERLRSRPKATAFQTNESRARHVERRLIAKDSPTTGPAASRVTRSSPTRIALGGSDRPMSISTAHFDATSARAPTSRSTHKTTST